MASFPSAMRGFFTRRVPDFDRVLLVESGSRRLIEDLIPHLYSKNREMRADLVTCYGGAPATLAPDRGTVYDVNGYSSNEARRSLVANLSANGYSVLGIVCSAEPILAKWKWVIAARIPAKIFILNENGDIFWLDYGHWAAIRHFAAYRAGLTGAGAVRTIARVLLFPFALLYLLLYAAAIHLRRILRTT